MVPEKSSSPTMPKMRKRKPASPMTHPSWGIAAKIEAMSTGIPGTKRRERNLMREAIRGHQESGGNVTGVGFVACVAL